jgi:gluconolactonase
MWNLSFKPPEVIHARVLTRLDDAHRRAVRSDWADANKPGEIVDCFLEGPCFDGLGNLYVTDIPHGRIFRITPALVWQCVADYGGWPNGLALHADGSLWIADYRQGVLRLNPANGEITTMLGHRNSESFKGVNDLMFDRFGNLYFTDQGQTGLHDPSGRVYRLGTSGKLDQLMNTAPSPNGIAVTEDGKTLFVAMTRANQVWRAPILSDGNISKMGAFQTFFGTSGPDGLALDAHGRLIVAHASLGAAFVLNTMGEVTHVIKSPTAGTAVTNVALRPNSNEVVLTESTTGMVSVAALPPAG